MSLSYCLQRNDLLMIDEVNYVHVILFTVVCNLSYIMGQEVDTIVMMDKVNNVHVILFTVKRPVDD